MNIQDIIYLIISVMTAVFAVFLFFRRPQEKGEINDAIFENQIKELSSKFDIRFQDMKEGVVKIMQNDLQEVKSEMREHIKNQHISDREVAAKLARLTTILEERLPNKIEN